MAADQELPDDQLPAGHTPVWIEPPPGTTQVQMLERVETIAGQYQDVRVLYSIGFSDKKAAVWCEERGWKYHNLFGFQGCEAQCVVLLSFATLHWMPELITRARNMLIIFKNE